MSGPAEGDDVPELVKAASTSSSSPADPNFSGEWLAVSHDNLEALLRAQGVPERNLASALAASVSIRQSIRHTSAPHAQRCPQPAVDAAGCPRLPLRLQR